MVTDALGNAARQPPHHPPISVQLVIAPPDEQRGVRLGPLRTTTLFGIQQMHRGTLLCADTPAGGVPRIQPAASARNGTNRHTARP